MFKELAKKFLPEFILRSLIYVLNIKAALTPIAKRTCNICGFEGFFRGFGRPWMLDARCPRCLSLERHRLLTLSIDNGSIVEFDNNDSAVLHFAAEPVLEKIFRSRFENYRTADLLERADLKINIENIDIGDAQFDIVIASHVLEHVDDKKAAREVRRILKSRGIFVCQVPIVEGWQNTYENKNIDDAQGRLLHFGQRDHVRFYGRDFRDRIMLSGFKLIKEITAEGPEVAIYGLRRGEKVFVFQKAQSENGNMP